MLCKFSVFYMLHMHDHVTLFSFNTSVSSLHKMFYSAVNVACHKKVQASNS